MKLECKTCLKYPVCKHKDILECEDLYRWLLEYEPCEVKAQNRYAYFEKWWGRELGVLNTHSKSISLKKERDPFQCIIANI